ncbi:MAG TPA: ExeM/NucH family extracellular endonuclease, partial [Nocardioidaceae bacterium]|nr:ExeM/NucH family extracellular endonuclease [Nocardioidaceae bacterium]
DDAVVLTHDGAAVDVIGQIGLGDDAAEWGSGLTSTQDNTLRRKSTVSAGDPDGSDAFDPSVEWDGFANGTFEGLGSHTAGPAPDVAPTVESTDPVVGATEVPNESVLTVTFSEEVDAAAGAFTLACDGTAVPVSVIGGPTTFSVDPDASLPAGGDCTLTVHAAHVTDRDGEQTAMAADDTTTFRVLEAGPVCDHSFIPIPTIQGSGSEAAVTGRVTTEGVVVGDVEGDNHLSGFYLQGVGDGTDGDPATSDGLFVYDGGDDQVTNGDLVRVTGNVSEFFGQTQVSSFGDDIVRCDVGQTVAATEVSLPFGGDVDADVDRERYEGMLVTFPQTLSVTEHFQLGRYGEVLLSSGGRLQQPTNVVLPGSEAQALQATNDRNQIVVDDSSDEQNPDPVPFARGGEPLTADNTLRGGDTATDIVGVLGYGHGSYRLQPLGALGGGPIEFQAANPRPTEPEEVGGDLKVASFNVLNYFNTFNERSTSGDDCTGGVAGPPMECRGADNAFEFERQADKIVAAIAGLDADVVGLIEIENDGYGPASAIQDLVDRLNARVGARTYDFIDVDARTDQVDALGDDAIKVGMLYKPATVRPIARTAVLNTHSFVYGGNDDPKNRPALAQMFKDDDGGRVTVAVNHLKSKGSDCKPVDPDTGDGQGNCNLTRTQAAEELAAWLAADPNGQKDSDVLVMGDLNSYAMEDPIRALEGAGFENLVEKFEGEDAYSYVFDGQWGYLDHALGSASLVDQVTGVTTWHINADEPTALDYDATFKSDSQDETLYAPTPYRSSDHDPVLVGLNLRR